MKKKKQLTNKEAKRGVLSWLFGRKAAKADCRTDLEIIVDDYIKCIRFLTDGKLATIVGFKDDVHEWLITDGLGEIDLDLIPHDNGKLTECRYEIEALIGDNGYDNGTILAALNEKILTMS